MKRKLNKRQAFTRYVYEESKKAIEQLRHQANTALNKATAWEKLYMKAQDRTQRLCRVSSSSYEFQDYIEVCVRIDKKCFRENSHAFMEVIKEEIPLEVMSHLQSRS